MLTKNEIIHWLNATDADRLQELYAQAYQVKLKHVGSVVYFRGIIEFSNICMKNCFYCGIRRDNALVERFQMPEQEILDCALFAHQLGYGSIVLQSGERTDEEFVARVECLLKKIKKISNGELGITLSLGEQSRETFARWFTAGAHRYLLRIETSNKALYQRLHPRDHSFDQRLACLDDLRALGYQVGTGVMIGLPGQTVEDLAEDILFFKKQDIDMIGMGPYIVHHNTPLAKESGEPIKSNNFLLALKMIALTRLHLEDVNIAATTALQALHSQGRELGLKAGANVIMPNITPTKYRDAYQLYEDKPCLDENAQMCRGCLERRIGAIGETIGYGKWGDAPHFGKKKERRIQGVEGRAAV